ncbi:MAG TPA: fused gamma-glutamyl-gamma-aminobutyrate hydrolase/peptidase, partial [Prevotellaceae bacterium]|nr:fused gamma-glutamyl-gamma-aminobutyrate hydrolase/peptidase [Prevotellaceae bacterium]
GCLDAGIMVAYIPQGERTDEGNSRALALAERKLEQIEALTQACPRFLGLARTPDDIARLKERGMKAIMRGIENGYAIGHDLSLLARFRRMGVVYMTLCHNGDNDICDSARGQAEHGGLSEFGRSVVTRMNELGMMVDLSHAAESSFYDALEVSRVPIVCSHSNSKAFCPHPRNLTDDQMRALARHGGVAQVTLYHGFLRQEGEATIMDVLEHLRHMVDVMGPEHVGIGTDFDGDGGVRGLRDASELIGFTRELLRRCYSRQDLQGIWGGNFLRVMRLAQGAATMR